MTARRDIDHLIRTYLEDGPAELPDRSYDAVRSHIDHTRQRVVFGPWKELNMSKFVVFATAAAAVLVVVALVGLNLVPRPGQLGGVGPTASPTSAPPTASASPTADGSVTPPTASPTATLIEPIDDAEAFRPLAAGTYYVDDPFPVQASFTVPIGWAVWGYYNPAATQVNLEKGGVGEVSLEIVDNVSADPCTKDLLDPPVGPSVDALVTALSTLSEFGFEVSPATDITIDGNPGVQLTMQAPVSAPCEDMWTWRTTTRQNGVGAGEYNELRILDVNGVRLVISVAYQNGLSPGGRFELDAVADSIQVSR